MKKIFVIAMIALCASCHDELDNPQWYSYAETQCADPWGFYPEDSQEELKDAIKNYLEGEGACVAEVEIIPANDIPIDLINCDACSCFSGRAIRVQGETADEPIFNDIGFEAEE